MCVILFAFRADPRYRLAVAANRDEYHERPAAPAAFWDDAPDILAGRDLQAGGTWLGVTRSGRFAALTNYREPDYVPSPDAPSRGHLVGAFLRGTAPALDYLESIRQSAGRYSGFSLLAFDGSTLAFFSNRGGSPFALEPGIYGLSNHLLDTPWPKVARGRDLLRTIIGGPASPVAAMFEILGDRSYADDSELPRTGLPLELERAMSPLFVAGPRYGTRSSTVVLLGASEIDFHERTFSADAEITGSRDFRIEIAD